MSITWYTYILECRDKSFYTGISDDLEQRVERHNAGHAASDCTSLAVAQLISGSGAIDLSGCSSLTTLLCAENDNLTSLNLSNAVNLLSFNCPLNSLTGSLDLSVNTNLTYVNAANNSLAEIILADTNNLPATFLYDSGVTIREP